MKVVDYVLTSIKDNGFGFSIINKSEKLDHYLTNSEYDKTSYEFSNDRMVLIYESNLNKETKDLINRSFQKHLSGD
ncbi:hypothetical protein F981_04010 [Acinetobacter guillouiae CIP 63.46]|nr:hypothetical protein F981_04010 [Acinetobacter guillouiae CIP 63.46]